MRKNSMPSPSRFLSTPSARRATLTDVLSMTVSMIFLSTPSARRATGWLLGRPVSSRISIHALREEGDKPPPLCWHWTSYFYPRPPRGGRRLLFISVLLLY